jgi:predicted alpha/beta superfamily hydrolase
MSPSIWFGQGAVIDFIREARTSRGRIYLDVGTSEGVGPLRDVRRLGRLLVRKGFRRRSRVKLPGSRRATERPTLRYLEAAGARHNEAAWAERLPGALEFLLR